LPGPSPDPAAILFPPPAGGPVFRTASRWSATIPSAILLAGLACSSGERAPSGASATGGKAPSGSATVTGAGATFPNPIYSKWFDAYAREKGVRINYQSIGSGGGIRQFIEGTVDFGATDGPMTDEQIAAVHGDV